MSLNLRAMRQPKLKNKTRVCNDAGNPESPLLISHFCVSLSLSVHLSHLLSCSAFLLAASPGRKRLVPPAPKCYLLQTGDPVGNKQISCLLRLRNCFPVLREETDCSAVSGSQPKRPEDGGMRWHACRNVSASGVTLWISREGGNF